MNCRASVIPIECSNDSGVEDAQEAPESAPITLEQSQRFSQSLLWKLQRAYFERAGIDAWRTGQVPHYVTSNPFIAGAYARVVAAYLRDLAAAGTVGTNKPLTIVELGAGSGRFAYHFLQKLLAPPRISLFDTTAIRYVMTDVTAANLAFWHQHAQLRPFFEAGVLDVARFDAEADQSLHLEISGIDLQPGNSSSPLVLIANYVFDGLPQDAWFQGGGVLHDSRVTLTAPPDAMDLCDPALLEKLDVAFEHVPTDCTPDIPVDMQFLIGEYQQAIGEGAFQLPTAALACVRRLSRLACGGFLLLSSDKGFCREEDLLYRPEPEITRHGSISLPVDYHAIARYVEALGGEALLPAQATSSLVVGAFLLDAPAGAIETRAAFAAAVDAFGPGDWFTVKKGVEAGASAMSVEQLLAAIRLGGFDAKLFMDISERLFALAGNAAPAERRACFTLARRIWEFYYELGEHRDLAFHLGSWMRELGYLEEAIRYFEISRATRGLQALTAYNLAFCHLGQQRAVQALGFVDGAIKADPQMAKARALRTQIRAVLRDEA